MQALKTLFIIVKSRVETHTKFSKGCISWLEAMQLAAFQCTAGLRASSALAYTIFLNVFIYRSINHQSSCSYIAVQKI